MKTALVLMERETHIITVYIIVIFLPKQKFMTDGHDIAVQADEDRLSFSDSSASLCTGMSAFIQPAI